MSTNSFLLFLALLFSSLLGAQSVPMLRVVDLETTPILAPYQHEISASLGDRGVVMYLNNTNNEITGQLYYQTLDTIKEIFTMPSRHDAQVMRALGNHVIVGYSRTSTPPFLELYVDANGEVGEVPDTLAQIEWSGSINGIEMIVRDGFTYTTDGTATGTQPLYDAGNLWSQLNDTLLYSIDHFPSRIIVSDGTIAGTREVYSGGDGSLSLSQTRAVPPKDPDGRWYFIKSNTDIFIVEDNNAWSVGDIQGVQDFVLINSEVRTANGLLFSAREVSFGQANFYITDGTLEGTKRFDHPVLGDNFRAGSTMGNSSETHQIVRSRDGDTFITDGSREGTIDWPGDENDPPSPGVTSLLLSTDRYDYFSASFPGLSSLYAYDLTDPTAFPVVVGTFESLVRRVFPLTGSEMLIVETYEEFFAYDPTSGDITSIGPWLQQFTGFEEVVSDGRYIRFGYDINDPFGLYSMIGYRAGESTTTVQTFSSNGKPANFRLGGDMLVHSRDDQGNFSMILSDGTEAGTQELGQLFPLNYNIGSDVFFLREWAGRYVVSPNRNLYPDLLGFSDGGANQLGVPSNHGYANLGYYEEIDEGYRSSLSRTDRILYNIYDRNLDLTQTVLPPAYVSQMDEFIEDSSLAPLGDGYVYLRGTRTSYPFGVPDSAISRLYYFEPGGVQRELRQDTIRDNQLPNTTNLMEHNGDVYVVYPVSGFTARALRITPEMSVDTVTDEAFVNLPANIFFQASIPQGLLYRNNNELGVLRLYRPELDESVTLFNFPSTTLRDIDATSVPHHTLVTLNITFGSENRRSFLIDSVGNTYPLTEGGRIEDVAIAPTGELQFIVNNADIGARGEYTAHTYDLVTHQELRVAQINPDLRILNNGPTLHRGQAFFTEADERDNVLYYHDLLDPDPVEGNVFTVSTPNDSIQRISGLSSVDGSLYLIAESEFYGREPYVLSDGDGKVVEGIVFSDDNENGVRDPGERGVPNVSVVFRDEDGVEQRVLSREDGRFFELVRGNRTFTVMVAEACANAIISPMEYSFDTAEDLAGLLQFAVKFQGGTPSPQVRFVAAPFRCNSEISSWLSVYNEGCGTAPAELRLTLPPETGVLNAEPAFSWQEGNVLVWELESLSPQETITVGLLLSTPNETFTGDEFPFLATATTAALSDTFARSYVLRCSYDPNDKRAFPVIEDYDGRQYALRDSTLNYVIRFQNTGNDVAETVRIEDRLSPSLDLSAFRFTGSSHPCDVKLSEQGLLSFTFNNINLIDSTTNPTASQGYVSFEVGIEPETKDFSALSNVAEIFFDRNPAIVTEPARNTVVTSVDKDNDSFRFWEECDDNNEGINPNAIEISNNGIDENCDGEDILLAAYGANGGPETSVFPNPGRGNFTVRLPNVNSTNYVIYDLYGRPLLKGTLSDGDTIDLQGQPSGTYLLHLTAFHRVTRLVKVR